MTDTRSKIRKATVYAAYVFCLGLFQAAMPPGLSIMGAKPDLTLVLAILAGYMFGTEDGIIVGLAAGFYRDMLSGRAIGLGMLLLMYGAILASVLFRHFFRRNIFFGLVQILIITVCYEMAVTVLTYIVPMLPDVSMRFSSLVLHFLKTLPWQLLANLAAGIPLIFGLTFLGPYKRGSRKDDRDESIVGDGAWRVN
jgi:rod shape-determining protein MreD